MNVRRERQKPNVRRNPQSGLLADLRSTLRRFSRVIGASFREHMPSAGNASSGRRLAASSHPARDQMLRSWRLAAH